MSIWSLTCKCLEQWSRFTVMDGSKLLPVCAADGVELRPAAMPKMVANRATNEPEVVLILWSLSAVLSERSEHWNHWEAETRGIRLWSHIFTDSIFIGFHGIVYCTQSALRYIPKTPFFWRFSANVSLPDHDFGSKFRNPPAAKVRESARLIVVQRWDSMLGLDRTLDSLGVWQMERWVMISKSSRHG